MKLIDRFPAWEILQKNAVRADIAEAKLAPARELYDKIAQDQVRSALYLECLNALLAGKRAENWGNNYFSPADAELFYFLLVLGGYEGGKENFRRTGCPVELFDRVWHDVSRWADFYHQERGIVAFPEFLLNWYVLHLTGRLFEFERLQFEIPRFANFNFSLAPTVHPGEPVVSMHIYHGAKLDFESAKRDLRQLPDFAARYFPDYDFRAVVCFSWLWDKEVRKMLPDSSNIAKLYDLGNPVQTEIESDAVWRCFGEKGIAGCPHPNPLQQQLIAHANGGGKFHYGALVFPWENLRNL